MPTRSLLLALALCLAASSAPGQPDVVLIFADEMSWAGTSVQMDPDRQDSRSCFHSTPSLERLAREGMHFTDPCAPHPCCSAIRLANQTGKFPSQLNMSDIINRNCGPFYERLPMVPPRHIDHIPHVETTIAELLKQHVRTAHRSW